MFFMHQCCHKKTKMTSATMHHDNDAQDKGNGMDTFKINDKAWTLVITKVQELRKQGETLESIGNLLRVNRSTIKVWLDNSKGGERTSFRDMLRYIDKLGIQLNEVFGESVSTSASIKKEPTAQIRNLRPLAQAEPAFVLPESTLPASVGVIVPVYAAAGAGAALERIEDEPLAQISIPMKYARAALFVVLVEGDSMEPTIRKGAYVGLDRESQKIVQGEVYGVNLPYEGVVLKRVYLDHSNNALVLKSDNPQHDPITLPIDGREGLIVGKAVWVMQDV
jgi:phage repressor protein C with HTH and peptisase S24 domain